MRSFDIREFDELALDLTRPGAGAELLVLVACLSAAWLIVFVVRGRSRPQQSVWFGDRIFDGVLCPILALLFAFAAKVGLQGTFKPAVFKVAIPILISLVVIRLSVRVLRRTFPDVRWVRSIERWISWLAWIAVVLWVTGVSPMVLDAMDDVHWKVGSASLTLRSAAEGALTAAVVMVVALWISAALEKRLLFRQTGSNLSLRKIAATLIRSVLLFVGLLVALSAVGIDLTALSVFGGAIGVGLGFGLQKIAANYISGFVILAERSVRIGDMVTVDGFEGRITDIRTRYTVIRSLTGREAIIPNETLITSTVENSSLADTRVSVGSAVQVAYGTDVKGLAPKLVEVMRAVPRVIDDPGPSVFLSAFSADGMDLKLNFWVADPENGQGNVRSAVNLAVLDCLDAEGVEIPFPQRTVHAVISREKRVADEAPADPGPCSE